jgi:hypothetical protein
MNSRDVEDRRMLKITIFGLDEFAREENDSLAKDFVVQIFLSNWRFLDGPAPLRCRRRRG